MPDILVSLTPARLSFGVFMFDIDHCAFLCSHLTPLSLYSHVRQSFPSLSFDTSLSMYSHLTPVFHCTHTWHQSFTALKSDTSLSLHFSFDTSVALSLQSHHTPVHYGIQFWHPFFYIFILDTSVSVLRCTQYDTTRSIYLCLPPVPRSSSVFIYEN